MYDLTIQDDIITICFEEFEELFRSSEILYKDGFNVFPYFMNKIRVIESKSIPHYHGGVEEKRPHLHLLLENEKQVEKIRSLL